MINLSHQKIIHLKKESLSDGIVINHDINRNLFWVSFKTGSEETILKLRYPDAFKNGFVEAANKEVQQEILKEMEMIYGSENVKESGLTIEGILSKRKISELMHFTKIENLTSIINHGLLSVEQLNEAGIQYHFNDAKRYDGRKNCICTSVEFPNPANLKTFRDKYPECSWAIIILDAQLILNHSCFFAEHNAATTYIKNDIKSRQSPEAFERMFAEVVQGKTNADGKVEKYTRKQMHNDISCLPTSYQAEILVENYIEQEFIKGVIFMNDNDMKKYQNMLAAKKINAQVFPELFTKYRNDFNFEV